MNEIIFVVEEDIDGGYDAKALTESIFTQGETLEDLTSNIRDAVECHYHVACNGVAAEKAERPVRLRGKLLEGLRSELIEEPMDAAYFEGLRLRVTIGK